ncbi:hypothetical protein [Microbispora sp. NPDC049125]|uniref:hypothetical protein n=1 Tax=Microbispora sp. NPDC049125 TaxID=3154929 RepID=UPI003467E763
MELSSRSAVRALAAISVAGVLSLILSAPAQAGPIGADGYCGERELCLFRLLGGGEQVDYTYDDLDFTNDNYWYYTGLGYAQSYLIVNNTVSRGNNQDDRCTATLYQLVGGGGSTITMPPYLSISNMGDVGFDNKASAVKWRCP